MTKAALRAIYKEKRKILSSPERSRFADLVLINFQKINLPFIKCVHTYLTLDDEIDTEQVIKYLEFRNPGLQVCIPKINTITRQIENFIYSEETEMNINEFGIVEPVNGDPVEAMDIDLILTPLLTFDENGYRVGYGKGFYDKFFSQCRNDAIKVGFSFFEPTKIIEDTNPFDIPLNYCVTPKKLYAF